MPRAWSSAARQPPTEEGEDPVTVLVTGYGPFLSKPLRNSSWDVASSLPALLPATSSNPTPVHIHVHHSAIRVSYPTVTALVPQLLPPGSPMRPSPSIILHIGLAAGRNYYTLERGAHGRGYGAIPDVDGARFTDGMAEKNFPSDIFPSVLETSFNVEDVERRWRKNLGHSDAVCSEEKPLPDVRLSPDAGNFLCGFIYYNSLAHYFKLSGDERPVVFLHVPDLSDDEEKLATGRAVAVALIRALVESRKEVGVVDKTERVVGWEDGRIAGTDNNFQ